MKVLVLGASGFVGSAVAAAFVRAGHLVYGQTRSARTSERLAAREIVPVVCDPFAGADVWARVARDVDVVVDALAGLGPKPALATLRTFQESAAHRAPCPVLPTYVYCSGHYVMAAGVRWTDERQPARARCNPGSAWRREVEDAVLRARAANGVVVRPVCVYGRGGGYFAQYHFGPALDALRRGRQRFASVAGTRTGTDGDGEGSGKIATVHRDDCAELFVAVAERGPACRGQVFVASNPATDNMRDILDGVVRVTGLEGWDAREPKDDGERAWVTPVLQKPSLGRALAGWTPRRIGLSDGIDVYWMSFLHSQPKEEQAEADWVVL